MLPLTSPKGGSKSEYVVKNKFFYIFVTDETSDFKFCKQLEFAEAHHKITPRRKSGHGIGLGQLPKNLGVSL